MNRATIAGAAFVTIHVLVALEFGQSTPAQKSTPVASAALVSATRPTAAHEGLLYGRVTSEDGAVYEGRLRFGGDEEALWSNYFNGYKDENPWLDHAPLEQLTTERHSMDILGYEISVARRPDLGRPMMARFGDIDRIEARGRDLKVRLKSGTVFHLDRYAADDYADGVRVWDGSRGVVDLKERQIRSIDFLPTPRLGSTPAPLYGTVRTREGAFTGFVQWDREACLVSDELKGHTAGGEASFRFDEIRSIERRPSGARVTLVDGREVTLTDTRRDARPNRGMYVDDPRYGRVLVSWEAFERVEFTPGGAVRAYPDFVAGRPLEGRVVTRSGREIAGRLVYDLDESETTETLDAPSQGVDYTIPFGMIVSIVPEGAAAGGSALRSTVKLQSGEELQLERTGDLGEGNAGVLIFVEGSPRAEYVSWSDVARIDLERPAGARPVAAGTRS